MESSIFELITELCDNHIDKRKCLYESVNVQPLIKKFRSKAFEVLLKKKYTTECVNELGNNVDPICHLLAWQYKLKNQLNQSEQADFLSNFMDKNNEILNNPKVRNVILFLLHLKGSCPPVEEINLKHSIWDKVLLKYKNCSENSALPYDLYPQERFQFPKTTESTTDLKNFTVYSTDSFKIEPVIALSLIKNPSKTREPVLSYSSHFKFEPISTIEPRLLDINNEYVERIYDEGYGSPVKQCIEDNIWKLVSKLPINQHRTWESLNDIDPKKELPFACESGPKTLHLFLKVLKENSPNYVNNESTFIEEKLVPHNKFIKDVKYMLVGITSDIFVTNAEGLFYIKKGIFVEGISSLALKSYCVDLLFCGSCYRGLNNLCTTNLYKNNDGYVFKELCESVKRYLAYYRVAALSFPDSLNLLSVHSHMRELRLQIGALAKVCSLPPATPLGQQRLRGAELLDYIYKEITETVDRNVQLVLYAVFYPCCQIYFSRFLQRWLFEGVLIDPFEEFIVKHESDYTKSRARIYWTRSFSLRQNTIPEFLSDLKGNILQCGKTMNLLKQCNPDASLYTHIMSRSLPLISCCLTPAQSQKLKQEIDCYYVEMSALCGPRISLYHRLRDRYGNEENAALLNLVEKKRALAFKEMELKKQFEAEEKAKLKRKIFEEMQEHMRLNAELKKKAKEDELKQELLIAEQAAQIEELRSKLVKEESKIIVKYYNNLIEAVDKRRNSFELRKQKILDSNLDISIDVSQGSDTTTLFNECFNNESEITIIEVPISVIEDLDTKKNNPEFVNIQKESKNLDVENSNLKSIKNPAEELLNQRNETFLQAKRNRSKVLNLEFDNNILKQTEIKPKILINNTTYLTEAQKNKLKVLSSEFGLFSEPIQKIKDTIENNGNIFENLPTTSENIKPEIILTNELTVNNSESNLASPGHEDVMNITHRKKILKLSKSNDLITIYEKQISNNEVTPMSIDSTPNTEYSATELQTPSSAKLSLNTDLCLETPSVLDSAILTSNSCMTDDGFKFPISESKTSIYESPRLLFANKKIFNITQNIPNSFRPMRVSKSEVEEIKNGNLKSLLFDSVYIPLEAQMKLVNSEIIKYFVNEQNFLSHLHSLRCYYFLFDGEFCRHITDNLFSKLYDSKSPTDLLSCRSLQLIIDGALHASSKIQENGDRLSFIVRNIPHSFDVRSTEVFDCLSLSYKINWPLNVILPYDTIEKYDIVFKYLLKLQHTSWVLQKISYELKSTQKESGIDETLLFSSPQYHKIQLYRHVMTHFIQTLQNYTVTEVIQTSWDELEHELKNVTTLDQLYTVHVSYIKTIMFRCLLNRKCVSIMKVIREIFVTILKFYNYLRTRSWNLREKEIYYTHPNFKKIEYIFGRFEEFAAFVFRVGNKMAKVGYQPHLIQMLDMLNVNDYYINKQQM